MDTFIYLGTSKYALRVLREILTKFDSKLLCIIDQNIDANCREVIANSIGEEVQPEIIFDSSVLQNPDFLRYLREEQPSLAISVHFSEILKEEFISIPQHGVVNLHSSYLPYNRGHFPEVWSIIRNTPAGMTLHYIDQGIDTGDIIDQERTAVLFDDTCESLAAKAEIAGINLVLKNWKSIICGNATAKAQTQKFPLNLHRHLDLISEIKLDQHYTGEELINILRSLTIPRLLKGAFFVDPDTGDRIWVQVYLERETKVSPTVE